MIEQINENWSVGTLEYPYGRGINISMTIKDIDKMYNDLKIKKVKFFQDLETHAYLVGSEISYDKEFLIQDPEGYALATKITLSHLLHLPSGCLLNKLRLSQALEYDTRLSRKMQALFSKFFVFLKMG